METAIQVEQALNDITQIYVSQTGNPATKVGFNSSLEGIFYGVAKIGQLMNKDLLNVRADNDIDNASGQQLDNYAQKKGILTRFSETGSSVGIFIIADPGTSYIAGANKFVSKSGVVFDIISDITISSLGYAYVKANSTTLGANTKVAAKSITKCTPAPTGHKSCWNDFMAIGGRDNEADSDFRNRIKNSLNIISKSTLAQYQQILINSNNRVLNVYKGGRNSSTGAFIIYVLSVDGLIFSNAEFDNMNTAIQDYLSLVEQQYGVEFKNVNFINIDISMRAEINSGVDMTTLTAEMQTAMQKKYDYRYVKANSTISRLDLMLIARNTTNVNRILDNYFYVNGSTQDIILGDLTFPRFRSFVIYDKNGNIISDNNNASEYEIFFQNTPDYDYLKLLKLI